MPDQPVNHLPRTVPPWEESKHTQCGRLQADVKRMSTAADYMRLVKREGSRRADYDYCITCVSRVQYGELSWEKHAAEIVSEWVGRSSFMIDPAKRDHVVASLFAIAAVIENHREEYDAHLAAQSDTISLRAAAYEKAKAKRQSHLRRI